MARGFDTQYIGRQNIVAGFTRCISCNRPTVLNSYTTRRFAFFFNVPILPLRKYRIIDECPHCGKRGRTSERKYARERKNNLKLMMAGFSKNPDDPDNCCHALRTLQVYEEKNWFKDIHNSYGLRFENNLQVQYVIAQGLCRFGEFDHAIEHCRTSIVLGGGKQVVELLNFCQLLMESAPENDKLEAMRLKPDSAVKAYIPLATVGFAFSVFLITCGIAAFRTNRAWIVNGSLKSYSFTLDDQTYHLDVGAQQQVKLKLGDHRLQTENAVAKAFTYSIPLIKQLFHKDLLVINPDSMVLLSQTSPTSSSKMLYSYGKQIHMLPGIRFPLLGLHQQKNVNDHSSHISMFRPPTHLEMIDQLTQVGDENAAEIYARRALMLNPISPESARLLEVALDHTDPEFARGFLKTGLSLDPPQLAWHTYYQECMLEHFPDHDLVREYMDPCKNQPNEPANFYLLARILPNREDALKFYEHAEIGKGMNGLGFYAIARKLFNNADYSEALAYADKSLSCAPANPEFNQLQEQILLALRKYDLLLTRNKNQSDDPVTKELQQNNVLFLTCAGYHQEAEAAALRFSEANGTGMSQFNAIRFYAVGNMKDYLSCLATAKDPRARYQELIYRNRITDADTELSNYSAHAWWEHLVVYCAAMEQGETAIAQHHLSEAIVEVESTIPRLSRISALLSAKAKPSVEQIMNLDIDAPEKALLCISMSYLYPEDSETFKALAGRYNFTPSHPQLLIKKWSASSLAQN